MIKFLWLLFLIIPLFGEDTIYQLPNQHTRFIDQLAKQFKQSKRILILTPSFNHHLVEKEILKQVKRGTSLTLIVHTITTASRSIVQYEHVDLKISSRPFTHTIIIVDERYLCTIEGSLDEEIFSSKYMRGHCSDDYEQISALRESIAPILQNSAFYLK
ncbi:hypothetical protein [Sulfuricurvum sp.]|uniref:hypothetical protein n=1 Tax=Sulfuricurvum sp. TaxID=2025608 RepID=UPI00263056CD|nr:hypothetical protein [Sulfuricurvum sp.]MDD2782075.1 hypothetical protein [Sulfuricurvum sp.]